MARNNPKPTDKLDWISDDTTNILEPLPSKKATGWLFGEKPPNNVFNFITNWLNRKTDYHAGQVQDWIVIDSDADEGDYATLAAYVADAPVAGDRILIKEDQTATAQVVLPANITLKFLDGASLLCATNIATSVLKLGSNPIIEGVLNIVLSQTGTTAKAVEIDGDNAVGRINIENSSTGTLTTGYHINANKTGNKIEGFLQNTGGGTITNEYVDNSTEDSNLIIVFDEESNSIKTNGKGFVDLLNAQTIAGPKTFTDNPIITNANPGVNYIETDRPLDNKHWRHIASGGSFYLVVRNDADDAEGVAYKVERTDTTVDLFNILATALQHNGITVPTISSINTFTNKELGTGTKIALGSDADGDIYYRDAGILKRLAKGSNGDVLGLASGVPTWSGNYGSYTPTITGVANYTSSTSRPAFWTRIGNVVTVRGLISSIAVPAAGSLTQFRLDLPVSSNIGSAWDVGGSGANLAAAGSSVDSVNMQGDSINDEVIFSLYPSATTNNVLSYTFSYEII